MNRGKLFRGWPAFVLRALPKRVAQPAYYRLFRAHSAQFPELFQGALLRFAPSVRMDLVPGDECHGDIAFTGVYELELTRFVVREAKMNGGLFVDVGANFGYYSLLWAGQGEKCRVMAFEASPRVFQGLSHNIEINDLSRRVTTSSQAVSDREGRLRFTEAPVGETGSGRVAVDGGLEVSATTLDHALERINEVAILKIDAEGHDFSVLCGAREAFRRRVFRHVFWEACPQDFETTYGKEFCQMARESGYEWAPLNARAQGQQIFHAARCGGKA